MMLVENSRICKFHSHDVQGIIIQGLVTGISNIKYWPVELYITASFLVMMLL